MVIYFEFKTNQIDILKHLNYISHKCICIVEQKNSLFFNLKKKIVFAVNKNNVKNRKIAKE